MNYEQFLFTLSKKAAKILVKLPSEPNGKEVNPLQLNSKLIFPNYEQDDKKPRISEQEARFAFCQAFEQTNHGLYYSVETPTEYNYSFKMSKKKVIEAIGDLKVYLKNSKKKKGQSAQSDMSIFTLEDSGFKQNINVEFKAHNVGLSYVAKDFLKLLAEPQHGLFFHLVEKMNSGTLVSIFKKYQTSIENTLIRIKEFNKKLSNDQKRGMIKYNNFNYFFAICILKPEKYLLTKIFTKSDFQKIEEFFDLEYSVSKGKIDFTEEQNKPTSWNILPL